MVDAPEKPDPGRSKSGGELLEGQSEMMKGLGSKALSAGMTFAVSVALFALGGHWLDERWGTEPWLLLLGALLGMAGGMIHLITVVSPGLLPFRRASDRPKSSDSRPHSRPGSKPDSKPDTKPGENPDAGPD